MLYKRIIPILLLDENYRVVKTETFSNPKYIGDPINTIKLFNEYEVDEIIILDISATKNNTEPNYELLKKISSESFVPLTYGGGIKNIKMIEKILDIGFEKVSINNIAIKDMQFIENVSKKFGSQSIVVALDLYGEKDISIYDYSRKKIIYNDAIDYIKKINNKNFGELFINFVDNDGSMNGFNLIMVKKILQIISRPLVVCGGAGEIDHLRELFLLGNCSAACGSFFVYANKNKGVLINYLTPDEKELLPIKIAETK